MRIMNQGRDMRMEEESSLLSRAITYASNAFYRWGKDPKTGNSKMIHSMEMLTIASSVTDDEEVLAASVLVEVLEKTSVSPEVLKDEFGERVAELADLENSGSSINYLQQLSIEGWLDGKASHVQSIQDPRQQILVLAKSLSEVRALFREYQAKGNSVWEQEPWYDPVALFQYHQKIIASLRDFSEYAAWKEYQMLVDLIFHKQLIRTSEEETFYCRPSTILDLVGENRILREARTIAQGIPDEASKDTLRKALDLGSHYILIQCINENIDQEMLEKLEEYE